MSRRGRKATILEADYLRAQVWFWGVMDVSGLPNAAAIEHVLSPHTFRKRESAAGGYIYPGYLAKIRRGEKCPGPKLVNKAEQLFPGTAYWYKHPFWDVIRYAGYNPSLAITHMEKIRSEHARALLYPPVDIREEMKSTSRSNTYMASAFGRLHDESDLDSLSALLIFQRLLTRKDKHDIEVAEYFSDQIMKIIIRCFAQVPFFHASGDLLNYVVRHFLELTNEHTWSQPLKNG